MLDLSTKLSCLRSFRGYYTLMVLEPKLSALCRSFYSYVANSITDIWTVIVVWYSCDRMLKPIRNKAKSFFISNIELNSKDQFIKKT